MENNYFFSVIVPCYNSKEYIKRLLESIQKQECKDEIEVLLIDDVSTEKYWDIVDTFTDLHIIKYVMPYHNGFPSNSNQKGSELATGKWLTFIDHDDEFVEYSLDQIKLIIEEDNIEYYLLSNFYAIDDTNKRYNEIVNTLSWTHGKFFNRENFWKKYNVHFVKDLKYCEDSALSVLVSCLSSQYELPLNNCNIFTYKWYLKTEKSLSSNMDYMIDSMPSYIENTGYQYLSFYKENRKNELYFKQEILSNIIKYYICSQYIIYNKRKFLKKDYKLIKKLYNEYKNVFNIESDEQFLEMLRENDYFYFCLMVINRTLGELPCLAEESFIGWMKKHIFKGKIK